MIRFCYFTIILTFYQIVSSRICGAHDDCALYKNAKFEWWGTDCGRFCHQAGQTVTCMWYQYHQGCFCKEGYYRSRKWDCVPLEGCGADIGGSSSVSKLKQKPIVEMTEQCPPNEEPNKCGNRCSNLCESLNNPKACKTKKCDQGCFCKKGLLRNYNGVCIRKEQCSKMMVSGSYKYKYSFSMSISLSLYIKTSFRKKCRKCSKSDKFEPLPSNQQCQKYEELTTCGDKCTEQCRNLYMTENCPLKCEAGCFCKLNHYRNNRGECVPPPKCPGYNQLKMRTSTTKRPRRTKPPKWAGRPKPTYVTTTSTTPKPVRNVSDSECPSNEKYSSCGSHCKEMCENANKGQSPIKGSRKCSPNMSCMEGCFCKPGYFRDKTDSCVPKKQCPPPPPPPKPPIKCKVNEEYTKCGSKCSESCNVFNETIDHNCPPKCSEGCFCIQGFYRDKFGACVPQDQCECEIPYQNCRDPKEEYLVCGKNCRQTCDQTAPVCQEACGRGCFCKEGFVYNENGVCTLPNQCGQDIRNGTKEGRRQIVKPGVKCPGANEKFSDCGNLCEDFCEPKFNVDNCPMTCETGCFCRKGYKRNSADQCVLIEKCGEKPVCVGNEEYTDCGTNCATRCKDIGHNVQCPLKCDKGCFCKKGFFRDEQNICIPRAKCPIDTTPDCPNNEIYKNCSTHCGETCEDLRNPVECPKPEEECDKGCFCDTDYYRDLDGTCGTKLDCNLPTVTKDTNCEENEVSKKCGNRCDESCEDSIKCKKTCEDGCFCIEDYLRNKKGKCVVSEKCKGPPQCAECKQNEYYTSCGTDCGRMCTDIGKDVKCGKDTPCHPGCLCKWGFYRTPDGECVTKNECQFFINEDEDPEYVTTDDPDGGLQSPGKPGKGRAKVKSFKSAHDYDNEYDYDHVDPDDDYSDSSRPRSRGPDRKNSRNNRRPSKNLRRPQNDFEESAPNAEIIGSNPYSNRNNYENY